MNKILVCNTLQVISITSPIILFIFFYDVDFYLHSDVLSLLICFFTSIFTALILKIHLSKVNMNFLDQPMPNEKSVAVKKACQFCFGKLWLIPNKSLIEISDANWSLSIKKYNPSVKAVMISSHGINLLIIGCLALFGIYMGFNSQFGFLSGELAKIINNINYKIMEIIILLISPWVSLIYLFNFFFRIFIGTNKI